MILDLSALTGGIISAAMTAGLKAETEKHSKKRMIFLLLNILLLYPLLLAAFFAAVRVWRIKAFGAGKAETALRVLSEPFI